MIKFNKTGGGKGTNQYAVKGASQAKKVATKAKITPAMAGTNYQPMREQYMMSDQWIADRTWAPMTQMLDGRDAPMFMVTEDEKGNQMVAAFQNNDMTDLRDPINSSELLEEYNASNADYGIEAAGTAAEMFESKWASRINGVDQPPPAQYPWDRLPSNNAKQARGRDLNTWASQAWEKNKP